MLAVLGRVASHAGEPLSVTVTDPTHTIYVHVPHDQAYGAWCREIETATTIVATDDLGSLASATAVLHGWRVDVRIVVA